MDPANIVDILGDEPTLFALGKHRELFETLCKMRLADQGTDFDFACVRETMLREGKYVFTFSELMEMANLTLRMNFLGDVQLLRDRARRRSIVNVGRSLMIALDEGSDPDEIAAKGLSGLMNTLQPAETLADDLWSIAHQVILRAESGILPDPIPTGFGHLDTLLGGGLRRKTIAILAARPAMGKSALAIQIARNAALAGKRVLVFSVEMSKESLAERVIAGEADLEPVALRVSYKKTDWGDVRRKIARLQNIGIRINDESDLTSARAAAIVYQVKAQDGKLDLIVVDYLQRLADSMTADENRNQALGRITGNFAILARKLNCAVLILSQLNRRVESAANKRPTLGDLRDSGEIEADADVVAFLYRPAYYPELATKDNQHTAELHVAKAREGPTGTVHLWWDAEHVRFRSVDIERGEQTA